jgi:hypothetical protein
MENAQLNTKQEFVANITNVGNALSVNQFVDAGFNLLNSNQITTEEFTSIMHEVLAHLQNTNKGA